MSKRFGKTKDYKDWLKPKIVKNALELLDEEIPKYKDQIDFVHLSFMTDPFMYKQPEVQQLTLKIIEKLNQNDIKCTTLTKGIYPKILEDTEKYGQNNEYGITLVSLDNGFKKDFEPYSSPYQERVNSLRYLHDAGLKTWVSIEPYPTPNLVQQNLRELLKAISFVDKIIFGKLNYTTKSNLFSDNEAFYEECANRVIQFCKNRAIDYHIKFGTQKTYNKKTAVIFEQNL
jgi:DNA repair photolyase